MQDSASLSSLSESLVAESVAATVYSSVLLDDLSHFLGRSWNFPSAPRWYFYPFPCLKHPSLCCLTS